MSSQDYEILLKIRADLQQALGGLGDLNKSIRGIGDTAKEVAGIVGVGFGVHEIVDFTKSIIDAQARMVDLSAQTGVSVENLSALQFAAHKAGVDTDTLAQSLSRLAVEAAKQNPAFAAMGISVKDSSGHLKDTSVLLGEVAAKFASYQDGPEKAALANAIFGKSGYNLIQMLDQLGTQGLDAVKEKAREAGALLGGDVAEQAKKFADSLDDLKTSARNAVAQGIDAMLPEMQQLVDLAKDPQAQEGLRAIGEGIAFVGVEAAKAAISVSDFMKWVGEELAAETHGIDPADAVRVDQRIDAINDRLKQLRELSDHPFSGSIKEFLQGFAQGPLGGALATTDLTRTVNGVKEEIAQLEKEKALLQARAKLFAAPAAKANDLAVASLLDSGNATALGFGLNGEKGRAPGLGGDGNGSNATDNAKALAAALAHLQDQLASLRTQGLDPTATAWAQYNKTVDEAVADAQKAGNTPEANAALNAIVVQAARIRDAALDKIAQQDRDAYEQLLKTISTPAEAKLQDAIAQIAQFNGMLIRGTISAQEYHDAIQKIGENIGMPAPEYRDPTQRHGGSDAYAQLANNVQAGRDLDQWKINEENRAKDLKNEEAYQARLAEIDQEYAQKRAVIESARQTLTLNATSEFFGNLASLSTSHNKKLAEIGKAAAIAQALINTYKNATIAYGDGLEAGGPYGVALGIAFAAAAVAAGLANVAAIESQSAGGYATGGYTGPGGKHEPAGIVHRGEIVWSQQDIARFGGIGAVEAVRTGVLPAYAVGGVVGDALMVDEAMRNDPGLPVDPQHAAVNDEIAAEVQRIGKQGASGSTGAKPTVALRIVNQIDQQTTLDHVASAEGEQTVMNIISRNQTKVRQMVK